MGFMEASENQMVWSNAESAILPVVTRLFTEGDDFAAFDRTFRYAGVREYIGTPSEHPRLRTRVVVVASTGSSTESALLFPVAIGPMLRQLESEPATFAKESLEDSVRETLRRAGLPPGELPGVAPHGSHYFAFCREMLARLDRLATPAIVTDEHGVARIRGTRVKALEVAASHLAHGWSAEEIRRQHPGLELGPIYAALAWYYDHRAECDRLLASQLDLAEGLRADQTDTPLRVRLKSAARAA